MRRVATGQWIFRASLALAPVLLAGGQSPKDRAADAFSEAKSLAGHGDRESYTKSLDKFAEALSFFKTANVPHGPS